MAQVRTSERILPIALLISARSIPPTRARSESIMDGVIWAFIPHKDLTTSTSDPRPAGVCKNCPLVLSMRTWSGVRLTIGDICPCICLFMPRILAHPCLGFEPVTVFLILDNSTVLFDGGSCQQRAICVYYVRAASPASEPVVLSHL